jgi:predicted dehydrogenase
MTALRWGILGTGGIARKFVDGLRMIADRCPIVAVGSRSASSAQTFAAGTMRAHGTYQALIDDPEVDVVYIALLNHQHAEWSIRAAEAGKHVLCEKPAAMTARELESVLSVVKKANTFFMEGFLYRCHPRWAELRQLLAGGVIGEVRISHATFCFNAPNVPRLLTKAMGGGALMDVGCYPISWLRWIAGAEPTATTCIATLGGDGVDVSASATLHFPNGIIGTVYTSCVAHRQVTASLIGSTGRIDIIEPWRSTPGEAAFIITNESGTKTIPCPDDGLNTYAREALTVAAHIHERQAPMMNWNDSRGQARCLDALRHQANIWWDGEK